MSLGAWLLAAAVYPLLAHVDVARGEHVGEVVTEIRIERVIYMSRDWCPDADPGEMYPAQIDKDHTTIRLQVGEKVCKYHIFGTRPLLRRGPPPS